MTNSIEVIGGNKSQHHYYYSMVDYCIKKLMPRIRTLDLTVKVKSLGGDAYGYCLCENRRTFEIEIASNVPLKQRMQALAHEMVHVKQYVRGELGFEGHWCGKFYNTDKLDYWDLPWEIEAHGREPGLYIRWVQEQKLTNRPWTVLPTVD